MDLLSTMIDLAVYLIIIITTTLTFGQIHEKLAVVGLILGVVVSMMIVGLALPLLIVSSIAAVVIVLTASRLREAGAED